jgi:predicted nuclease of restriction endonuclease-like (RecB) superfamily
MNSNELTTDTGYQSLLGKISEVYATGQARAAQAVNVHITETYWRIGRDIVEFEQGGNIRADYGKALLTKLSRDLTLRHGKGFSRSNVVRIRQFYLAYPKGATLSHLLSWSHIVELLKIDDPLERGFYEQQAIREKWAVRELKRQKETSLFLRLAAGKDKDAILQLAAQGQIIAQPADLLRDPYVFEFLKIPEPHQVSETDWKPASAITSSPSSWNLAKASPSSAGNTASPSTTPITGSISSFYHRILRCFVLIDLKINDVEAPRHRPDEHVSRLLRRRGEREGDNPPIGIIFTRNKDELLVEYATYQMNSQLFVQKYQLYLPDREELRRELELTLQLADDSARDEKP